MTKNFKTELLSPAGNFEKLRSALHFGADAVYLAGKRFGMRAAADNFSELITNAIYREGGIFTLKKFFEKR